MKEWHKLEAGQRRCTHWVSHSKHTFDWTSQRLLEVTQFGDATKLRLSRWQRSCETFGRTGGGHGESGQIWRRGSRGCWLSGSVKCIGRLWALRGFGCSISELWGLKSLPVTAKMVQSHYTLCLPLLGQTLRAGSFQLRHHQIFHFTFECVIWLCMRMYFSNFLFFWLSLIISFLPTY